MNFFTHKPSRDPKRIREVIEQLCDEMSVPLGADLESVILYGSLVRLGALETEHDKINLLFVLRRVDCLTLDKMVDPLVHAEKEIPLSTMTLTHEDLTSSCDVFPIKFRDMQLHHQLLRGTDVLSELEISDTHLRLRCEQQLKNLLLRLRALYLHRGLNRQQLMSTLEEANRDFLTDVRACLALKTGVVPELDADLAGNFGSEFELDANVVDEIRRLGKRSEAAEHAKLKQIFDRFMQLVHDAALAVDRMEVIS